MLSGEVLGVYNKFEGWLIECDEEARKVEFKQGAASPAKRNRDEESTSSLDCLLADKEGAVMGGMWGEAATKVLRIWHSRNQRCPKLLVQFEVVRVS